MQLTHVQIIDVGVLLVFNVEVIFLVSFSKFDALTFIIPQDKGETKFMILCPLEFTFTQFLFCVTFVS